MNRWVLLAVLVCMVGCRGGSGKRTESLVVTRHRQQTQIDARAQSLTPRTSEDGALQGFFDGEVLLKIHGERLLEHGRVDVDSYYQNEKLALVSVTQRLFDRTDPSKTTWSERNVLYFDDTGTLATVVDNDGNEMTGDAAERARHAFLDPLGVESWPDHWSHP